jgi:hypothetical protein
MTTTQRIRLALGPHTLIVGITSLLSACTAEVIDEPLDEETAVASAAESLTLDQRIAGCNNDPRVLARAVSLDVCVGADLFFRETFAGISF